MEQKDYYKILGVTSSASQDEIKKAYRKLAKGCHPDTHPGDKQAEENFKEISQAYDILGDEKKRKQYDQMKAAFSQGFRPGGFDFSGTGFDLNELFRQAARGGRGGAARNIHYDDLGGLGGLGDIFSQFMDQGAHFRQARGAPQKGNDLVASVSITFDQAIKGGKVRLTIQRDEICPECGGSGAAPGSTPETCPECGGTGTVTMTQGGFAISRPCPRCYGKGKIITHPCPRCQGRGVALVKKKLSVKIPAGVSSGAKIRLRGQGEPGPGGGSPGDLILRVTVGADPRFTRKGADLYTRVSVNMTTAALGGTVTVRTLTGEAGLKIPAGTQPGTVLRMKKQGAPRPGSKKKGDLYLTVTVTIPTKLTSKQKELLKELSG
ncbi:MAG: molecular chaperone DnaJ [Candidatus Euphemobacter frigidus]|nr:molecular chaperone DnaJ [Candidatus Euphemobacter frigidus]MDP8275718.1 molecular chaperone DnaJ [Candidatus Euphemobacter frigidus]